MQKFNIIPTEKSLGIICENGRIQIKGCSIINDPGSFFKPFKTWTENYIKSPEEVTVIEFKIDYIDSASTKYIFEILKYFERIQSKKSSVKMIWYYSLQDPEILELGEILAGRLRIPSEFIKY